MLQRSRVLSNAETSGCIRSMATRQPGFNGAAFFRTRKLLERVYPPVDGAGELQRSRVLSNAETLRNSTSNATPMAKCFNGAAFFRTRKLRRSSSPPSSIIRFNGAAFFRTRKPGMWPSTGTRAWMLQRSRVLSNAETRAISNFTRYDNELQRSRVLSNAETPGIAGNIRPCIGLQRSRVLSNAETSGCMRCPRSGRISFNGAAFFRTRKLSHREKASCLTVSFNGAAFFRTRKLAHELRVAQLYMLQRSRVLSNAETARPDGGRCGAAHASTEPRSFERGNESPSDVLSAPQQLQRSRVLSNAETHVIPSGQRVPIHRFNGAAFFRTRKRCRRYSDSPGISPGFNGAAFFRTRKPARWENPSGRSSGASTEPRSFERGNPGDRRRLNWREPLLQRSRVLSNAETRICRAPGDRALSFNGAAFFRTRKLEFAFCCRAKPRASTEPRSFERGNRRVRDGPPGETLASTEPRSFERGNRRGFVDAGDRAQLQRSRVLSNAETPSAPTNVSYRKWLQRSRVLSNAETSVSAGVCEASKGASTEPRSFERGNRSTAWSPTPSRNCFNGAAFFRTRKPGAGGRRADRRTLASTEPRSFERGNALLIGHSGAGRKGFNGAAFFRTRKRLVQAGNLVIRGHASTEPRSFERGNPLHRYDYFLQGSASTEPRSFERGNRQSSMQTPAESSFNGAAFFRTRKR